jgi:hypothetical protein
MSSRERAFVLREKSRCLLVLANATERAESPRALSRFSIPGPQRLLTAFTLWPNRAAPRANALEPISAW